MNWSWFSFLTGVISSYACYCILDNFVSKRNAQNAYEADKLRRINEALSQKKWEEIEGVRLKRDQEEICAMVHIVSSSSPTIH